MLGFNYNNSLINKLVSKQATIQSMFKNLFVFTKQANTTAAKEEEEKNGGNSDLIEMPPKD